MVSIFDAEFPHPGSSPRSFVRRVLLLAACVVLLPSAGRETGVARAEVVPKPPESSRFRGPETHASRTIAGSWGGVGASLEVPEKGPARIELDCAHGSIQAPLEVGPDGTFTWPGTFAGERGGPTRQENRDEPVANYRGALDGDTLTITITIESGKSTVGPLLLQKDRVPRLRKCR